MLAQWSGAQLLEDWDIDSSGTTLVMTLPRVPEAAESVRSARITLRPGHAEQVVIEPLVYRNETGDYQTALEMAFRTIRLPIPVDADQDEVLTFSFPLGEAATGNWHDAAAPCRLTGLRITASSDQPIKTEIEQIVFVGERTALSHQPATPTSVEIDGIVRPAWMLATGAKVEFEVDVPEGSPVLRWYDGAIGEAGPRAIRLISDESSEEVMVEHGAGSWTAEYFSSTLGLGRGLRWNFLMLAPPRREGQAQKQAARRNRRLRHSGDFVTPGGGAATGHPSSIWSTPCALIVSVPWGAAFCCQDPDSRPPGRPRCKVYDSDQLFQLDKTRCRNADDRDPTDNPWSWNKLEPGISCLTPSRFSNNVLRRPDGARVPSPPIPSPAACQSSSGASTPLICRVPGRGGSEPFCIRRQTNCTNLCLPGSTKHPSVHSSLTSTRWRFTKTRCPTTSATAPKTCPTTTGPSAAPTRSSESSFRILRIGVA